MGNTNSVDRLKDQSFSLVLWHLLPQAYPGLKFGEDQDTLPSSSETEHGLNYYGDPSRVEETERINVFLQGLIKEGRHQVLLDLLNQRLGFVPTEPVLEEVEGEVIQLGNIPDPDIGRQVTDSGTGVSSSPEVEE